MIGKIVIAVAGALFALILAGEITGISVKENQKYGQPTDRGNAYFLCVVFVFAFAMFLGLAGGKSSERRDQIAWIVFVVTIIPALIGVRLGLGREK